MSALCIIQHSILCEFSFAGIEKRRKRKRLSPARKFLIARITPSLTAQTLNKSPAISSKKPSMREMTSDYDYAYADFTRKSMYAFGGPKFRRLVEYASGTYPLCSSVIKADGSILLRTVNKLWIQRDVDANGCLTFRALSSSRNSYPPSYYFRERFDEFL